MSEKIGRDSHVCRRDELPRFMDSSRWDKYDDGDIVRCSCGRVYYVEHGVFCYYKQLRGRRLKRALVLMGDTE